MILEYRFYLQKGAARAPTKWGNLLFRKFTVKPKFAPLLSSPPLQPDGRNMIISQIWSVFSRHYVVSCLAIICGNMLAFAAIYGFFPVLRHFVAGEDRVVESLSALFFLAAFVFALVLLRKKMARRRPLIVVAVLALVGFLDEISFGGRIVGVEFPRYYGVYFDGVHDVVTISFDWTFDQLGNLLFLILFIAICAAGTLIFLWCRKHLSQPGQLAEYLDEYFFGGLFCIFLPAAIVIDLHIVDWDHLGLIEELLEMNAALVLLFYCAGKWIPRNLESQPQAG